MDLLQVIFSVAIFGLIVWAITTMIPMPEQFRRAIYVLSVIGLVFYILRTVGLFTNLPLR